MITLLTILIAFVSVALIFIVLIQNPKGGGLNSAFGGSASASQMLGAANTTDVLEKTTWGLAAILFALCLSIGVLFKGGNTNNSTDGANPDFSNTTGTTPQGTPGTVIPNGGGTTPNQ